MKPKLAFLLLILLALTLANPSPVPPYIDWASAATNIQDAIDAASAGDEIVVTNGVYANSVTGGAGALVVNKKLTVRSVSGPEATVIAGNGYNQCVYFSDKATMIGFTISNGNGGGAAGTFIGIEKTGTLNNCILTGNVAYAGGGASYCTLNGCVLAGNSADFGGGAANCTLNNCILTGNSAACGGGVIDCVLNNCTLRGNSATFGGGAYGGTLNNCILSGNTAQEGGGAYNFFPTLRLNNCTITGNSAGRGGGVGGFRGDDGFEPDRPAFLNNCIVYSNEAPMGANYSVCVFGYSCTTPLPDGIGNIDAAPGFVDLAAGDFRLLPRSPCIDAGMDLGSFITTDIRGHPRPLDGNGDGVVAFDMGAYESAPPTLRYVNCANPSPAPPYTTWATAARNIQDAVDAADSGDEVVVTNGVYATGEQVVGGAAMNRVAVTKPLTLRSVNGPEVTLIQGYQVPGATNGDGAVRCVYLGDGAALLGFTLTNGATRGVFVSFESERSGGGIWCTTLSVMVSNCVLVGNSAAYLGGGTYQGTFHNCTLMGNSAQGGGGAFQSMLNNCRLIGNSAYEGGGAGLGTLNNCILVGNSALTDGGGVTGGILNNCTLTGNSAGHFGGGASRGTLHNCTLEDNTAGFSGGGAFGGTLNNCTLIKNWANQTGGGAGGQCFGFSVVVSKLNNCIVYYNVAGQEGDNYNSFSELNSSCTTPFPPTGHGNFENRPHLVDLVGGDFRLQSDSPCINAGKNAFAPDGTDLDGNPRISGGTVDIGAYEFQNPASSLSYDWLQQFGLPIDGSVDFADPDGDHFNNFQEWRAGTDPTNGLSALRLLTPSFDGIHWLVSWQSVPERTYTVEQSVNLSVSDRFVPVATTVPGQPGTTTIIDTNSTAPGPTLYRVRVDE